MSKSDENSYSLKRDAKPDWKPSTIRWRVGECGHWIRTDIYVAGCPRCVQFDLDRPYVDEALELDAPPPRIRALPHARRT